MRMNLAKLRESSMSRSFKRARMIFQTGSGPLSSTASSSTLMRGCPCFFSPVAEREEMSSKNEESARR